MPLPRTLARINRKVTNPVLGTFAGWLYPFAIIEHRGRKSGRVYRIPVVAFRRRGGWVFALTYGASADWVQNVLAAGHARLKSGGTWHELTAPRLVTGAQSQRMVPLVVRPILALIDATECLAMEDAAA